MIRGIDHIEICVRDIDEVAEFYKKFGMEEVRRTEHHGKTVEMRIPGTKTIFEFHTGKYEELPGINHIAFRVDDVDTEVEELKEKGVEFHTDIILSKGSGRKVCNFRDPMYFRYQITSHNND
jgi:catechol 2,3-dioxygenase-like lactoylglutathione lyase family enzyme